MHALSPTKFRTVKWILLVFYASLLTVLLAIVVWRVFCFNLTNELRGHHIHYYASRFCDIKTVPWRERERMMEREGERARIRERVRERIRERERMRERRRENFFPGGY